MRLKRTNIKKEAGVGTFKKRERERDILERGFSTCRNQSKDIKNILTLNDLHNEQVDV